ncbi:regulator of hypoxia-inducible factor 1 isoform X2 [Tribolium castaneum]|nr:PREDICTED: regulator of hypoxia-inducible factor 1 isoform X1 [Tribolium castaneum]XP_015840664.1 PREDICTED: regulator of hypoxia-inducible factor 1 isoform X2 [Tribolium castaneum]|eukprot:XP_015840663.1 PREDICTED: regulator of hypoxia-inducible factor 1 isoform X1 [Tribolium castaneum]
MLKLCILCVLCVTCCAVPNYNSKLFTQWRDFPSKIFLNTSLLRPECQQAYENFLDGLNKHDLNALKMLDATAKIPSGILNGNIVQYGDFNECMGVKTAQYCLAEIDFGALWNESYSEYRDLVQSFNFFKDTFDAPAHRVPGFTMARWGFCIPQECSAEDLEKSLSANFGVLAQIRPGMCQKATKESKDLTRGDYIARLFFICVVLLVVSSTLVDYYRDGKGVAHTNGIFMKILQCFSLRENVSKFFEVKENDRSEIAGLHGIRFLNALALLMSHKSVSLFFNPYMNRTAAVDRVSRPWTIIAKNAIVYTDVFMLISGLLNANALLTDLHNGRAMKFKEKLINRIFRILPNVIALILFCTYILPLMGSGPLWPVVVDHHSTLCKQHMWKNIFFIHNYFGFENMCLTHTHQLGIDMQLFLVTPVFVYLIWTFKRIGLFFMGVVALLSTILRFWVSYEHELTSVVYFGISVSKMFSVASLSYILPTHRATIYLIGVYLAYLLKCSKPNTSFTKWQVAFLWCFFLPMFLGAWLGPYHMVTKDYVYDKLEASYVLALYPIFWGSSVAFGIYAINRDIAGWLGTLFNWKYFQISTKLAYALYLVQFPIFFYNVGLTKHVDEYRTYLQLEVVETIVIILCSFLLVLLIEMPFQNIKKVLFDQPKRRDQHQHMRLKDFKSG